jgi:hypothetical protein
MVRIPNGSEMALVPQRVSHPSYVSDRFNKFRCNSLATKALSHKGYSINYKLQPPIWDLLFEIFRITACGGE